MWMNLPGLPCAWRCWACELRSLMLCSKGVLINECFITCSDLWKELLICMILLEVLVHTDMVLLLLIIQHMWQILWKFCMCADKIFKHDSNESSIKPIKAADCETYVFMKFTWFVPHFCLYISWIDILCRVDWGSNLFITKIPISFTLE